MRDLRDVLPEDASRYRGEGWVPYFAALLSVIITARSLIHVARADGGASSIAGIDLEVEGGRNIVSIFAQWGLEQLLLAGVAWVVLLRYRGLVPLVLLINLLDCFGRIAVGRAKPLEVAELPPGAYGSWLGIPVLGAALWCSLPAQAADPPVRCADSPPA